MTDRRGQTTNNKTLDGCTDSTQWLKHRTVGKETDGQPDLSANHNQTPIYNIEFDQISLWLQQGSKVKELSIKSNSSIAKK